VSTYAITASAAPIAVVFHRVARAWLLAQWNIENGAVELGAWFNGTLYPRRCDLSSDGSLLAYFALKGSGPRFLGQAGVKTYQAISKSPWLFALAAWPEDGTWTRGCYFTSAPGNLGPPAWGSENRFWGLMHRQPIQYANERRRGWIEDITCPPRGPNDAWDEHRQVVLTKPRPAGKGRLLLSDTGWKSNVPGRIESRRPLFVLEQKKRRIELPEATWADWNSRGQLLTCTANGLLQIRDTDSPQLLVIKEHHLESASRT